MSTHGSSALGIDTHKHTHVAVILDGLGRHQGSLQIPASDEGATDLLAWSRHRGAPLVAGIEGAGSYGYQLTRALQAAGLTVVEVNRPDRANRRRKGKSDPVDDEDVPSSVELRWRPDSSGDVHEVILHDGSDSFGDLAFERGA
jgi:transposase